MWAVRSSASVPISRPDRLSGRDRRREADPGPEAAHAVLLLELRPGVPADGHVPMGSVAGLDPRDPLGNVDGPAEIVGAEGEPARPGMGRAEGSAMSLATGALPGASRRAPAEGCPSRRETSPGIARPASSLPRDDPRHIPKRPPDSRDHALMAKRTPSRLFCSLSCPSPRVRARKRGRSPAPLRRPGVARPHRSAAPRARRGRERRRRADREARAEWFERMHRAAPGVDWRAIEEQNRRAKSCRATRSPRSGRRLPGTRRRRLRAVVLGRSGLAEPGGAHAVRGCRSGARRGALSTSAPRSADCGAGRPTARTGRRSPRRRLRRLRRRGGSRARGPRGPRPARRAAARRCCAPRTAARRGWTRPSSAGRSSAAGAWCARRPRGSILLFGAADVPGVGRRSALFGSDDEGRSFWLRHWFGVRRDGDVDALDRERDGRRRLGARGGAPASLLRRRDGASARRWSWTPARPRVTSRARRPAAPSSTWRCVRAGEWNLHRSDDAGATRASSVPTRSGARRPRWSPSPTTRTD